MNSALEAAHNGRATAVVVNDDPTQLHLLGALIEQAGFQPCLYPDAEAALATMDPDSPPALIVSDVYMPGIDGWRFCRLLRSADYPAFNDVPILVISATFSGDEPDRIAAEIGADAFLSAPVDAVRFVEKVRAVLEGNRQRRLPRVLIVEDSETLAGLLQNAFTHDGYEADVAYTRSDGMMAFDERAYDVAVIDYHLPDGHGDLLLDRFRARRTGCACIMMTGDLNPSLSLNWMKRGAAAYVHKPFSPDYLLELCARARRERTLMRSEELLEKRTLELRKSEERFRALAENTSDGMLILENDVIVYASPAHCKMLGYLPEEQIGLDRDGIVAMIHPEDVEAVLDKVSQAVREQQASATYAYRVRHKDGSYVWREDRTTFRYSPDGRYAGAYVVSRDISERVQAERELRDRESRLRLALEVARMGHWRYDCASNRVEWFSGHEVLFGISSGDFGGTLDHVQKIVHPDDRERGAENLRQAIANRQPFDNTYRVVHPDGSVHWLHSYGLVHVNKAGEPDHVFGVTQDITQSRLAEQEQQKLQDQLYQAARMDSIGRLAGGVAHDFNNMLGVILGYTELAIDSVPQDHPLHSDLLNIHAAAKRSTELTRQLLAFSRKQGADPQVLDLNKSVDEIMVLLRRLIGEQIDLAWHPDPVPGRVRIDPTQLDQVLVNLCVNARDASGDMGRITIDTACVQVDADQCSTHPEVLPGPYVRLSVGDNGRGMEPSLVSRVFEPFFTTKELGKGTGLGLSTVYGIVRQNGGFIEVQSKPGKGTVFRLYWPRVEETAETWGGPDSADRAAPPSSAATILLVEDEPSLLRIAKGMISRLGYDVLTASTAAEALQAADEHQGEISLLVTDMRLPDQLGRELAEQLLPRRPEMKCLFMSGHSAEVFTQNAPLPDGSFFIQKPFTSADLSETLTDILSR